MSAFSAVALLAALFLSGCRAGERPTARITAETGFHTQSERTIDPGATTLRLAGAIGEVLGVHFTVLAGNAAVSSPRLEPTDFQGADGIISANAVELFRLHTVAVSHWPGWHIRSIPASQREPAPLDILVPIDAPRGGMPNQLAPGIAYHFWADVRIPMGVNGGTYSSRLSVMSEGKETDAIALELTVWPFVLPRENDFETIADLDHDALIARTFHTTTSALGSGTDTRAILLDAVRQMRRHRVNGVFPTLAPGVGIGGTSHLSMDWELFDEIVPPILSGEAFQDRSPTKRWPIPIHPSLPLTQHESPARRRLLAEYLVGAVKHFREQGWDERSYLLSRDPRTSETVSPRELATLIGAAAGEVELVSTIPSQDLRPYGWTEYPFDDLRDVADEWAPSAQFLDRNASARELDAGRPTWLCVDRPPFCGSLEISAPPPFARVLPWQAASLGATRLYLGTVLDWPKSGQASLAQCAATYPANLLYPGTTFGMNEPVMSLRLKHLRRGLQDVAYLRLLRDHGRSAIAERILASIVRYLGTEAYDAHYADGSPIGWPTDSRTFEGARRVMAEEMLRVVAAGAGASDDGGFSRTAAWRRFNEMVRERAFIADGVRMRMAGSPANPQVSISTHVALHYDAIDEEGGAFRLDEWPAAWNVGATLETFRHSRGKGRRHVLIETLVPFDSVSSAGSFDLAGIVEFNNDERRKTSVPVRCVTARRCAQRPAIDGDLSDWPAGTTNVAANFQSIAYAPGEGDPSTRAAQSATTAFVMRDDEYLYVAINAKAPTMTTTPSRSRKLVTYDDTIPVGEELVELLFDPLNLATRSPESLYHIVVKRNGADLAEKGIALDPPVATRAPWAADTDVAVSSQIDRWTAEVRIPLSSFGVGPFRNVFWGFNVTRFDVERSEYSTWSGAQGNAYDPISLGNLLLLP